jgi:hypothetical protein
VQLDIVIENSFSPSLPSIPASNARLFFAESIAAVIEVKSNIATQWTQVIHTAKQLAPLKKQILSSMAFG